MDNEKFMNDEIPIIYSDYPTEDDYRKDLISNIKKANYKDMKEVSNTLEYTLSSYALMDNCILSINQKVNGFNKIDDYKKIKEYCAGFDEYQIYDYLYFIGITNVKEDISDDELLLLMDKCAELSGEYIDPIEVGQSLASEIYENKSITIEQLELLSLDDFYDWYNNDRELGNKLKIEESEEKSL